MGRDRSLLLWPLWGTGAGTLGFLAGWGILALIQPGAAQNLFIISYVGALSLSVIFFVKLWSRFGLKSRRWYRLLLREGLRALAHAGALGLAYGLTRQLVFRFEAMILPHPLSVLILGLTISVILSGLSALCAAALGGLRRPQASLCLLGLCLLASDGSSYPATHYEVIRDMSRLKQPFPDVLSDAPRFVRGIGPVPILCLIHDSHLYPCELLRITVRASFKDAQSGETTDIAKDWDYKAKSIQEHLWSDLLFLDTPEGFCGDIEIKTLFDMNVGENPYAVVNDNFEGLSHSPLSVTVTRAALPSFPGWVSGDAHVHSSFTDNQVEFAAPLQAIQVLAQAAGLGWAACVDHSFDLDDKREDTFHNDPDFPRWFDYLAEVNKLNQESPDFVLLRGEELSCRNAFGFDVHMLLMGNSRLVPGGGDASEGFPVRPQPATIQSAIESLEPGAIAYAAHPWRGRDYLQALCINRTSWLEQDLKHTGLSGMQFWNGREPYGDVRDQWVGFLLEGRHLLALAGSDSHGDFNRNRRCVLPMFNLSEDFRRYLGVARTVAYVGDTLSAETILSSLKQGRTVVTNGPMMRLSAENANGQTVGIGENIPGPIQRVVLEAISTEEFGPIQEIRLFAGRAGDTQEEALSFAPQPDSFAISIPQDLAAPLSSGYLRGEVTSLRGEDSFLCITNPIWVAPR